MRFLRKSISVMILLVFVISLFPLSANAKVIYMPDVTAEMSKASCWSDKMNDPDKVLTDQDSIAAINQAIIDADGTGVMDIVEWSRENPTFDGVARAQKLRTAAEADSKTFYSWGACYGEDGTRYASWDEAYENFYKEIIDNAVDPAATTEMPIKYGICTKRACLINLPTNKPVLEDPNDPDNDDLYQTMVRVNEPLILRSVSADGQFYHAVTSCTTGWIDKDYVAICADRDEWLNAWKFDESETLVVYDDKIYTEESQVTPEVSCVKLPMGTCLKLASDEECEGWINHRTAHNNHVVWLPIRKTDGTYDKKLCLIGENRKVSEGFLPVTSANIVAVAMNQLGDPYGWGAQLSSEDCSGYVRDVYKCFGLELARNTTGQPNQPVKKWKLSGLSDEEKVELIKRLPVGAVLFFNGHEMIYLGEDNGKLYVISSLQSIVLNGEVTQVRGGIINTLDMTRKNGNTWLRELTTANIPYLAAGAKKNMSDSDIVVSDIESLIYNGEFQEPDVTVADNAGTLIKDKDFTLSYSNNKDIGAASVTVTAAVDSADYTGSVTKKFVIRDATDDKTVEAAKTKILALPAPEDITTADRDAITAARAVYDILTEGEKSRVGIELLEKLIKAENALLSAEEAAKQVAITSVILSKSSYTYNGKIQRPKIKYVIAGDKIVIADNYDVVYSGGDSTDAGKYTVTVIGKGRFTGSASASYTINKAANPVKITAKNVAVSYKSLKKKAKTVKRASAIAVKGAATKLSYTLTKVKNTKFKKYFRVNNKTGNITVKKGLGKGSYKLTVKVKAAGNNNFKALTGTATVTIKVR